MTRHSSATSKEKYQSVVGKACHRGTREPAPSVAAHEWLGAIGTVVKNSGVGTPNGKADRLADAAYELSEKAHSIGRTASRSSSAPNGSYLNHLAASAHDNAETAHLVASREYSKKGNSEMADLHQNNANVHAAEKRKFENRLSKFGNRNINDESFVFTPLTSEKLENAAFKAPVDGWIMVAPMGEHPHPSKCVQVIDKTSVDSMVSNFNKQKQNPNFAGILLDADHRSQGDDTGAYGWIDNLASRSNGLWAHVKWTDDGEKAINGGKYRLVSPVWKRGDCETMEGNKLRPLVLDSVALTNNPNLKNLIPITQLA